MHRRTALLAVLGLSLLALAAPSSAAAADFPPKDSGYHNYAEMVAEIQEAEADHPDIVDVFSIGKSYQNRNIWAAKISDNVADDENEPEVLFDGLHHAREHLTVEQTLAILRWLSDGYGSDDEITGLVDTREIWIIFNGQPRRRGVRPHRFAVPRAGARTASRTRARRPSAPTSTATTATAGRAAAGHPARSRPTRITARRRSRPRSRGSSATSSTAGWWAGASRSRPRSRSTPPARRSSGRTATRNTDIPSDMTADDHAALVAIGKRMAASNGYEPKQSSSLYVTDGDEIDWAYGVHRIFMYTFEMYPSHSQVSSTARFYPPDEVITRETNRNREAVLQIISRAGCLYSAIGKTTTHCGPFFDDFEAPTGWKTNPHGTDTATGGKWVRANPETTTYQSGSVTSGSRGAGHRLQGGRGGPVVRRRRAG